jgi:hypothetical protein
MRRRYGKNSKSCDAHIPAPTGLISHEEKDRNYQASVSGSQHIEGDMGGRIAVLEDTQEVKQARHGVLDVKTERRREPAAVYNPCRFSPPQADARSCCEDMEGSN